MATRYGLQTKGQPPLGGSPRRDYTIADAIIAMLNMQGIPVPGGQPLPVVMAQLPTQLKANPSAPPALAPVERTATQKIDIAQAINGLQPPPTYQSLVEEPYDAYMQTLAERYGEPTPPPTLPQIPLLSDVVGAPPEPPQETIYDTIARGLSVLLGVANPDVAGVIIPETDKRISERLARRAAADMDRYQRLAALYGQDQQDQRWAHTAEMDAWAKREGLREDLSARKLQSLTTAYNAQMRDWTAQQRLKAESALKERLAAIKNMQDQGLKVRDILFSTISRYALQVPAEEQPQFLANSFALAKSIFNIDFTMPEYEPVTSLKERSLDHLDQFRKAVHALNQYKASNDVAYKKELLKIAWAKLQAYADDVYSRIAARSAINESTQKLAQDISSNIAAANKILKSIQDQVDTDISAGQYGKVEQMLNSADQVLETLLRLHQQLNNQLDNDTPLTLVPTPGQPPPLTLVPTPGQPPPPSAAPTPGQPPPRLPTSRPPGQPPPPSAAPTPGQPSPQLPMVPPDRQRPAPRRPQLNHRDNNARGITRAQQIRQAIDRAIEREVKAVNTPIITADVVKRLAAAESSYNPNAQSAAGAMGVLQLMPGTASTIKRQGRTIDPWNIDDNVYGGVQVLKRYYDRLTNYFVNKTGSKPSANQRLRWALAAYNWGPSNVEKLLNAGKDWDDLPKEVRIFVNKIAPSTK